ncbi:MAG: Hpt domain-containing protein, partial [Planctomycetota bacterium]
MDDTELLAEFVEEARDHLGSVEMQLLQIEALGADINDDLVNTVFRAIHSVKGAAGFLGLTQINNVAHSLENVLGKVREHQLVPTPFNVDVMLKAADRLSNLVEDCDGSNATDNAELCGKLDELLTGAQGAGEESADEEAPRDAADGAAETLEVAESGVSEATDTKEPATDDVDSTKPEPAAEAAKPAVEAAEPAAEATKPVVEPAKPAAAAPKPAKPSAGADRGSSESRGGGVATPEASIRVGVRVLDRLMNLAGELVLSRNQLLRVLGEHNTGAANLDS